MPRIHLDAATKTEEYCALQKEAHALKETNDCAVKAVTIVTGMPYHIIHEAMRMEGRKQGKGTAMSITHKVLERFGKVAREVRIDREFVAKYPGRFNTVRGVTTHHPVRFNAVWANGKTYLLRTRGHILAVVNGTNHDWTKGKAQRVLWAYEIISV